MTGSTSSTSTGTGFPCHGSRLMRSAKNSQIARRIESSGSAVSAPGQPVELGAGGEPEDHEQRVQAQRVPHHLRDDDVALDLLDAEEEERHPERRERMHDERVDERRRSAEPRAEVGDHLRQRDPRAEEECVLLRVRQQAG